MMYTERVNEKHFPEFDTFPKLNFQKKFKVRSFRPKDRPAHGAGLRDPDDLVRPKVPDDVEDQEARPVEGRQLHGQGLKREDHSVRKLYLGHQVEAQGSNLGCQSARSLSGTN